VCAWLTGQYGISDVYLGVEAELGAGGVKKVVETKLTDDELAGLKAAADAVKEKASSLNEL
jgi:malate dehydrogenase